MQQSATLHSRFLWIGKRSSRGQARGAGRGGVSMWATGSMWHVGHRKHAIRGPQPTAAVSGCHQPRALGYPEQRLATQLGCTINWHVAGECHHSALHHCGQPHARSTSGGGGAKQTAAWRQAQPGRACLWLTAQLPAPIHSRRGYLSPRAGEGEQEGEGHSGSPHHGVSAGRCSGRGVKGRRLCAKRGKGGDICKEANKSP